MNYPKAIYLMTNEVITITIEEEKAIKENLKAGAEWIEVQGNLINAKSVSKVGNHHATDYMEKIEGVQTKTDLKIKESEIKKLEGEKMYA
jgi:hypothetical protein